MLGWNRWNNYRREQSSQGLPQRMKFRVPSDDFVVFIQNHVANSVFPPGVFEIASIDNLDMFWPIHIMGNILGGGGSSRH